MFEKHRQKFLHFIDKPYNNPLIFEFKVTQDYR